METRNERIVRLCEERMSMIEEMDFSEDYHRAEYAELDAIKRHIRNHPNTFIDTEATRGLIAQENANIESYQ